MGRLCSYRSAWLSLARQLMARFSHIKSGMSLGLSTSPCLSPNLDVKRQTEADYDDDNNDGDANA